VGSCIISGNPSKGFIHLSLISFLIALRAYLTWTNLGLSFSNLTFDRDLGVWPSLVGHSEVFPTQSLGGGREAANNKQLRVQSQTIFC